MLMAKLKSEYDIYTKEYIRRAKLFFYPFDKYYDYFV